MKFLILAGILVCPTTNRIIKSPEPWDYCRDADAMETARLRCSSYYGEEAPCLKWFIKMEPGVYRAICGKAE